VRVLPVSSFLLATLVVGAALAPGARGERRVPGSTDDVLSSEPLYSQHKEELIIRHFFADRRGGFFVDVGSYHWRRWSTTYYLEKHLGWSGIAIDALSELADGYTRNRPNTSFFNYIVTDHSGTRETLYKAGGLSSTKEDHLALFTEAPPEPETVEVPTITLNELLDQNGVSRIDFLSMDIEQGEPAALAGFDIERFRPQLVCIEATRTIRDAISAYFAAHDYERIDAYLEYDAQNWYYRPGASPAVPGGWAVALTGVAVVAAAGFLLTRRRRAG
jgi:FkbM family methyltransferase